MFTGLSAAIVTAVMCQRQTGESHTYRELLGQQGSTKGGHHREGSG